MAMQESLERTKVLVGVLKTVGNVDFTRFKLDFKERLLLQKTVYFLQLFKIPFNYSFSWYLHGPYSPDLARNLYETIDVAKTVPSVRFVGETFEQKFNAYVEFLGERGKDPVWMEVLASLHFLWNLNRQSSSNSKLQEEIIQMVREKQPRLSERDCREAWRYLVEKGLIK